jgi:hypothetical protein
MRVSLIVTLLLFMLYTSFSQQAPVQWTFSSSKSGDKMYEVKFIATINASWHIYGSVVDEDVGVPTKITFSKNPLVKVLDDLKIEGELKQQQEDGHSLAYYEKQVTFIYRVEVKAEAKTNVVGKIEFMACTNERCLPPNRVSFTIPLK